jgi:ATP-dependent DNA helicase RecG
MTGLSDDIRQVVAAGRNAQVDWFPEDGAPDLIAATLVAMANSQGGKLLIGIFHDTIAGVGDPETTIDQVLQAALTIDPPLIIPLPRAVQVRDKTVIVTQIPPGMPHIYSLGGRYLYRKGFENFPLSSRDLRRLLLERGELSFETEIARGASLDDLDWDKVKEYVASLKGISENSVEQLLFKRGCLTQQDGQPRPTNAGILLFARDPQRHIRGAEITAVRFAGESMSDTFTRQDILGTLPDQIRRAEMFLIDHLRKGVQLRHTMERKERFEYPMEAARELVVNAVAHRDYSISGDGILLLIFSNRMEVRSPGGLPGPVTIANIKDERFSRNPAIVQVLADMGFIERLGYGVDRVIELMRQQNLREPEFVETGGGFRVVLYNRPDAPLGGDEDSPSIEQLAMYKGIPLNPRQEVALIYLHTQGNTRITNSDLQNLCPDVHPETIRRDLADLVTKNILEKMGQKRGSYYVLKPG